MKISRRDQILLHLFKHKCEPTTYHAPLELTQEGIASATKLYRGNLPRETKILIADGLIYTRKSHITGPKLRIRNIYYLTPKGHQVARALKDMIDKEMEKPVSIDINHITVTNSYYVPRYLAQRIENQIIDELKKMGYDK